MENVPCWSTVWFWLVKLYSLLGYADFGIGFDTASSIALLAISAIAQRGPNGDSISHGKIVILPFLVSISSRGCGILTLFQFTAGMSLVDSLDSILMLYAYATPDSTSPEGKLALLQHPDYKDFQVEETVATTLTAEGGQTEGHLIEQIDVPQGEIERLETEDNLKAKTGNEISVEEERVGGSSRVDNIGGARNERVMKAKANTMSSLSIILTLLSILVALR